MASNARTASLLVLLQLGSRLVTFSLNQALLSYTTPAAFGTAAVQLEPLLNTVLFLCREGIRGAVARQPRDSISSTEVIKLSLLPLALGLPLTLAGFCLYASNTSPAVYQQQFFATSVLVYGLSTVIELGSEPYFNRAQLDLDVKLRVSIEGTAVIARAVTTLLFVLCGQDRYALLAFGAGQLAYALILLIRYSWHYCSLAALQDSPPKQTTKGKHVTKLAYALTKQSFVKQVLTEGDKIIVSRISPIEDQGGYGLALNYGSLVARVLFQPLEESSRLFYSREMGNLRTESNEKTDEQQRNHKSPAEKSVTLLQQLLKFQIYLTLIFVCFCPFYTTPLLYHLLRGSRWMSTSAPRLLQEYLFLLPLLGFNGILEAFVQATASEEQLGRMSKALLVWSGIYCACCYIAVTVLGMKEDALILANAITMACRIAYSVGFINRLCHKLGASFSIGAIVWQTKLPIVASLLTTPVLRWSKSHFHWSEVQGMLLHIGVGGLCFLVCAAAGLYSERDIIRRYLQTGKTNESSRKEK